MVASRFGNKADFSLVFGASKIHTTQEGHRKLRSPTEMRQILKQEIGQQDGKCATCYANFTDCNEIVPDHIEPKGISLSILDVKPAACSFVCSSAMCRRNSFIVVQLVQ